ncbi:MAG: hypothetical protein JW708_12560, partial [Vallitaleaceae bacterium]|nr:hypothetical protein [Vallitaleaceae bacterium]
VDEENFLPLILSGIENVTLCSYLLQPKGYQNISKILDAIELSDETSENRAVTAGSLVKLAKEAFELDKYKYQARKEYLRREEYSAFCALCHHCVDLCPNRANRSVQVRGKKVVIHLASLCNECGLCSHYCIMGHDPYLEKYVLEDANQFLLGEYGKLEADFDGI